MGVIEGMAQGFAQLLDWHMLLYFLLGTVNGLIFGILPGLSGSLGIALMIPLTFSLSTEQAMVLFVAALSGQTFAGSISAILLNTPGTSPNAATTYDGYPLARQGRGGFAIGVSAMASALGSSFGILVLILLVPLARMIILSFSFPEITMLAVLGLAAIAAASQESILKGLIAGGLGIMVSFIGFDTVTGELRYVFGIPALYEGVDVVAAMIGLFAIAEVIRLVAKGETIAQNIEQLRFSRSQVWQGVKYVFTEPVLFLRSATIGTVAGIIPGIGGTVASFLAYFQAVGTARDPEKFGKGDPRGVLAPEAANDAKDAGAALPTMAFGIPGSSDWAIILGAMVMHGITPGPNLLRTEPDLIWVVIFVVLGASWLTSLIGVMVGDNLVQITRLRPSLLAPIVAVLALTGAYALNKQFVDVLWALGFGLVGYYMKIYKVPAVPLVLGLLLGATVERAFYQTMQVSDNGLLIFLTRPISLVLVILAVLVLLSPVFIARKGKGARRNHA